MKTTSNPWQMSTKSILVICQEWIKGKIVQAQVEKQVVGYRKQLVER